jgi:site-specific DNA recombinase
MARVMVTMGNKSSRDTSRRVAVWRETGAAAGAYGGGLRPYGYRPDPDAPKYRKTLLVVPAEAAEIEAAAEAILGGQSVRSLARSLRERSVPTVSGAKWTAETLRNVLCKPAIAGISVHTDAKLGARTEHKASWGSSRGSAPTPAIRGTCGRRSTCNACI